jgi:small subunit ribosomal protein S6
MNNYELMLVIKTGIEDIKRDEAIELAKSVIVSGGEVVDMHVLGDKKLAYPIQKLKEGYYVVVTFKANPDIPKELMRRLDIADAVLRFLVTTIPGNRLMIDKTPKIVEPVLRNDEADDSESDFADIAFPSDFGNGANDNANDEEESETAGAESEPATETKPEETKAEEAVPNAEKTPQAPIAEKPATETEPDKAANDKNGEALSETAQPPLEENIGGTK